MINLDMQVKEKESLRLNQGKLKESNINMSLNSFINKNESVEDSDLKKRNDELECEVMELKKELELKEMAGKHNINADELEKIKNDNIILISQLNEEKEKNERASQEILQLKESMKFTTITKENNEKAKKYNLCLSYVKQVLGMWKPVMGNEQFLFNQLKKLVENDEKENNGV